MSWRGFSAKFLLRKSVMSSEATIEAIETQKELNLPDKQVSFVFNKFKIPAVRFAMLFIGKIFIFGLIYWAVFFMRPDAFNFSSGFNTKPLSGFLDEFYETDDPSALYALDYQARVNKFNNAALELEGRYQESLLLEREKNAKQAAFDELYRELDEERVKEVDLYHKANILPLESESDEIEQKLATGNYSPQQRIAMRTLNLAISRELVKQHSYIISNYGGFGSADLRDRVQAEDQKLQALREKYLKAEEVFREQRREVYDAFSETRADILNSIGLVDFLYFSACVSTTTTFGDITANNRWVRLLVILQILTGIMIMAFLIQSVTAKNNSQDMNEGMN